jgi:undecaprenyl pyrophosphate synthase
MAGRKASPPNGPMRRPPIVATATEPDHDPYRARYVAIIADGNGRWAQSHGLSVHDGHKAGADTLKARLRDAVELGIEELTMYSFSTENWSRPADDVGHCL